MHTYGPFGAGVCAVHTILIAGGDDDSGGGGGVYCSSGGGGNRTPGLIRLIE